MDLIVHMLATDKKSLRERGMEAATAQDSWAVTDSIPLSPRHR